ncbi:hypothetical protein ACJJTC_005182 [Scirpophaga incertulas]
MSRSRKILDMLMKDAEEPEICSSLVNDSAICVDKSINAVSVGNEDEIAMTPATSPLPPGAEEISKKLADVWEDVMKEGKTQETTCCDSSEPILTTSYQPGEDIYSNQLSTFSLEVPSSFENSPIIPFEDLEDSHDRSTPINSELSVPTPMPSPTNTHSICDNVFCPYMFDDLLIVSSSSASTTAALHTTVCTVTTKTTKKRPRRQKEWTAIKRKCLKNLGKKYVTKAGKFVDEKTMGPSCKCRYKCAEKISYQQRLDCFTKFWQLGDRAMQWNFIIKYSDKMKKKKCLNQDTPNNRKYTFKYYLPLITDFSQSHCQRTEVCQTMFINTLAVSTRILKTAWNKYDGSASVEEDRRGRHDSHKIIINDAMKQSVCDHVRAFDPIESHYIRKNSHKLYLQGDLSIAKMYKLYLEWFDPEKYTTKATSERQYRDIVNSNFNLRFHVPKKDQCNECHIFKLKKEPTDREKDAFQQHQTNKEVTRVLKTQDKKDAEESNGVIVTAVFDFEKVLQCPHGNINVFYYKRKLSSFNFTVFDMGKRRALCYMWDESVAKRGANEVSSCLLDFIQSNVEQGTKEFRFWSDNCAGQNRNRFVFSSYIYASKKFNIRITHRFLLKGHTQNEGDSVHSVIERASKTKTVYTPHEWRLLVRWAKTEGEPYLVRNVTQSDVFDFKRLVNNKIWMKDITGKKITWNNIREICADGSDPNKLFFKYDLTQPDYYILVVCGNTRNSVLTELQTAYSQPLMIPTAKYKDLIDMCRSEVIPTEYHSYFDSLPHHINNDISEESNDDLSE